MDRRRTMFDNGTSLEMEVSHEAPVESKGPDYSNHLATNESMAAMSSNAYVIDRAVL